MAEPLKTVFNPFTGKLDYITRIDSNTVQGGTGCTTTSNSNGTVTVNCTGGGSSSLGVNFNGVSITSPTAQINFKGPGVSVAAIGSTATVTISSWSGSGSSAAGSLGQAQYNGGAGIFAASSGTFVTSSSWTFTQPVAITSSGTSSSETSLCINNLELPNSQSQCNESGTEASGAYGFYSHVSGSGGNFGAHQQDVIAVTGRADATTQGDGWDIGVLGIAANSTFSNYGVWGIVSTSSGPAYALYGQCNGSGLGTCDGIHAEAESFNGTNIGGDFVANNNTAAGTNTGVKVVVGNGLLDIGLDIAAAGGTSEYGILVRSGQVQINSTMTVAGTSTFQKGISASTLTISGIASGIQCLHTDSSGNVTGTGSDCGPGGTGGVTVYPATATASFPFGLSASTINVNGSGDGVITLTISGSTYTVIASSIVPTIGHFAVFSSTSGTIADGGTGSGGAGTPGGSTTQVQYNNGGSFGGIAGSVVGTSSVTFGPLSVSTSTTVTINSGDYLLSIASTSLAGGTTVFAVDNVGNVYSTGTISAQFGVTSSTLNVTGLSTLNNTNIKNGTSLNFLTSSGNSGASISNPFGLGVSYFEVISSSGIGINVANAQTGVDLSLPVIVVLTSATIGGSTTNTSPSLTVIGSTMSVNGVQFSTAIVGGYGIHISTTGHFNVYNSSVTQGPTFTNGTGDASCSDTACIITASGSPLVMTFAKPYTKIPVCTVTEQTDSLVNALSYSKTASALTITQTGLSGAVLDVICLGRD